MARAIKAQKSFDTPPSDVAVKADGLAEAFESFSNKEPYLGDDPIIKSLWSPTLSANSETTGTLQRLRGLRSLLGLVGGKNNNIASLETDEVFALKVLAIATEFVFQHEFAHFAFEHEATRAVISEQGISTDVLLSMEEVFCDSYAAKALAAKAIALHKCGFT